MKTWSDLTPEEKVSRGRICSAVCFIFAFAAVLYLAIGVVRSDRVRERCTVETEGRIFSVHPAGRYSPQAYLHASYSVDGIEYRTKGAYSADDGIGIFGAEGKTVPVFYDPADPAVSYACDSPLRPNAVVCILISAVFIAAGGLFIWQSRMIGLEPGISDAEIVRRVNKAGFIHINIDDGSGNNKR